MGEHFGEHFGAANSANTSTNTSTTATNATQAPPQSAELVNWAWKQLKTEFPKLQGLRGTLMKGAMRAILVVIRALTPAIFNDLCKKKLIPALKGPLG
jgi:hypothetical protein